jgi:hypothetical protein
LQNVGKNPATDSPDLDLNNSDPTFGEVKQDFKYPSLKNNLRKATYFNTQNTLSFFANTQS